VGTGIVGTPIFLAFVFWFIRIAQRINQTLRTQMVSRVQAMSLRFHSEARVGDSIYRTYQDSAMMANLMMMLGRPIPSLLGALIALVICLPFAWWLPLLLLACYAVQQQLGRRLAGSLWRGFREAREKNSDLTSRIQETLAGIKVVKAFGTEDAEQERFERDSREAFRAAFAARNRLAWIQIVSFTVTALPLMLGGAVLALLAARADPTFAGAALAFTGFAFWNLGAYQAAMGRLSDGGNASSALLSMWAQALDMTVGMNRAFAQVDLQPEVQNEAGAVPVPPFRDAVTFRGVSFAYQRDRPVLTGVDLRAEAGMITAIVGPTGSGKSTAVALLLRLFDPDSGAIEIDGIDLRRFDLESLRRNISIALQENLLFGTTIRENIRYAVPNATDAQVREAARIACADAFIEEQLEGYDTQLGERGAKLSTGQRQRLSIARAIIKDTPILVLDEPTASLDASTELSVMRNLGEWGRGRAIFLITHRLSTIRRANQILYLREGRVIEAGSHAELMALPDGSYRRFVELEESSRPEAEA
jgi:ABC-type multidrug transport system fused ATPase/permease subunit